MKEEECKEWWSKLSRRERLEHLSKCKCKQALYHYLKVNKQDPSKDGFEDHKDFMVVMCLLGKSKKTVWETIKEAHNERKRAKP